MGNPRIKVKEFGFPQPNITLEADSLWETLGISEKLVVSLGQNPINSS